ncbi:hypothetical protein [Paraliomyxa miuraensis]|uniref:hypothetical protein n=1 Tax=Paraliomyxa miuraensis TaxID=376150 RepID=UPI00224DC9BD|nr:hypothetical protein [Paraliomyxa miuraensis]MCX4244877.1 hypothetical protein [Paraliomyxa miuraensis]
MKPTIPTLLALLLLVPACGKPKTDTTNPGDTTASTTDGGDAGAVTDEPQPEPPPAQDPDPAELAQGVHQVLTGNYEEAIATLEPIHTGMREPSQMRASGLAGGWLAVAHAQIVFENAEAPAQYGLEMASKLQDPEVEAAAKLGRGALLLAQEDYDAAKQALQAAAAASPASAQGILAQVLHAQALIGTAFGSAESTELAKPEDLDAAKRSYEAALQAAGGTGAEADILKGRANEGLAAVAKYKRDKAALCAAAFAAVDQYKAAGASSFLLDGPSRMASDEKCKKK